MYTAMREPNYHIRPDVQSLPTSHNYNQHANILLDKHQRAIYIFFQLIQA